MSIRITHDAHAPTASVELKITQPLEDFDLIEIEAPTPRDVDPMLASQGFKDLLDEARAILEREFAGHGLKIDQLTGAICHDNDTHRPGIWIVVRETSAKQEGMSPEARARVAAAAESVRANLRLS
ncbi:MAG: hypothetical protein WBE20_15675 [Candidatus Acidiferrales bacterium]